MIQRKQTLFLLGAFIAYLLCLCFPVGVIVPESFGSTVNVHCLGLSSVDSGIQIDTTCVPLFILCALSAVIALVTIFLYKNRKQQMNLCKILWLFTGIWYVDYIVMLMGLIGFEKQQGSMSLSWAACLPLIALILSVMGYAGINHDEKLVRSADRIR